MRYARRLGVAVGLLSVLTIGVFACVGAESALTPPETDAGADTGANATDGTAANQDTGTLTDAGVVDAAVVDAGACEAGATICNGACVDTASSGPNCGSCGHTCGAGAACSKSICQPVLLEKSPDGGGPIVTLTTDQSDDNPASNAAHIVWSTSGASAAVFEDNVTGGNLVQLSTTASPARSIVIHGGTVYWLGFNPGGPPQPILQATLGTAASQTTFGTMNASSLTAVTFDAADERLVGSYVPSTGMFGIFKCTTPAPSTCTSVVTYNGTPTLDVATDGTSLFLADQDTGFFVQETLTTGATSSVPLAAATPTLVRVHGTGAGGYLYWANSGTSTLWRSTLNVNTQKQIASSANADGIAADTVNVYWSDPTTGTIFYAPIGGGGPTTPYAVMGASSNPMRMVRDQSSLYFIHNTAIYRLALP